ncbi:hypothetical protein ACLB2K_020835 [Fragaria x ananassa]
MPSRDSVVESATSGVREDSGETRGVREELARQAESAETGETSGVRSDSCEINQLYVSVVSGSQNEWGCTDGPEREEERYGLGRDTETQDEVPGRGVSSRSLVLLSASCGHPFCRDCWAAYISTTICDGGPACVRLRCPEPSCNAAVGPDLIEKVLLNTNPGAEHGKYKTYLLRSYVEDQKNIKWCPATDCNYAIQFHALGGLMVSYDVSCLCSHRYCWNCIEENHCPVDCETVGKWILKNKDDSENTQWILVNSNPCPKCKRPIEKNQGCNHMTCNPPCGYQFCWLCLGPNKSYSGCYCNRFRQGSVDNPETSMNTDEKARKKAKMYLERCVHYYERWETNGRSKKKALEDFNKVKTEHIKQLGEIQGNTREHEYDFIIEAWQQIIDCRQVLRWTYAYGYYLPEDAAAKKHLFECLQGYAEFSLERAPRVNYNRFWSHHHRQLMKISKSARQNSWG